MAAARALSRKALLESLEKRLDRLACTLAEAEIAEKSVEIVKEIKELHALLHAMREPRSAGRQRLTVVWGGPEQQGASSAGPGRLAAPPLLERAARASAAPSGNARRPGKSCAPPAVAGAGQKPRSLPCDPHAEAQEEAGPAARAAPQGCADKNTGPPPRN